MQQRALLGFPAGSGIVPGQDVALVGAGNSAGQAIVYLAARVRKVFMLVRGSSLEASMSSYLVNRIRAQPNVEICTETEVVALEGEAGVLKAVRCRNTRTGEETERRVRHLFSFIGADPNTAWLAACEVAVDQKGFVRTGSDLGLRTPLETSRSGIFAIGDVRAGSTKRVASAVGEGAQIVQTLHGYLADIRPLASAADNLAAQSPKPCIRPSRQVDQQPSRDFVLKPQQRRFTIAPMMDWTDRHCRVFHRILSRHALLYTEMVTTGALIHGPRTRLLGFDPSEHPVAVQLGGSDPDDLARAATLCAEFGYDEVNLNVGCPSDRVQNGRFGACLMREPVLVGRCVAAMKAAVRLPVTVKCRIGVDDQDPVEALGRLGRGGRGSRGRCRDGSRPQGLAAGTLAEGEPGRAAARLRAGLRSEAPEAGLVDLDQRRAQDAR